MWIVQGLVYLFIVVFIIGVIGKALKYANTPMHLRWELYPVPHEKDREYGGSYLEDMDWWTKPRKTSTIAMLKDMAAEMLLIKTLWQHNRSQWIFSFPFHTGLYLLVGFIVLLIVGAIVQIAGWSVGAGEPILLALLYYLTIVVGLVGLVLAVIGSAGLLYRRMTDFNLRQYSSFSDYFNLVFMVVIFLVALVSWASIDQSFGMLRQFFVGLITLSPAPMAGLVVAEVLLATLLMAYIPFTHMTHFVGKYFAWHEIRWDDAPNIRGSRVERNIPVNLTKPIGWSASHIGEGQSWAEVATGVSRPKAPASEVPAEAAKEV